MEYFTTKPAGYQQQPGRPVQILTPTVDYFFDLDEDRLEQILLQHEIRDRYAVVVSVAGDYRKGKSFLLGYFIRYLDHVYGEGGSPSEGAAWMGRPNEPLVGFKWKYGADRQTTGIWLWSKLYLTTLKNGDKVAILLMDTQGTFDCQSSLWQSVTVFAMSALVSSVTCFNVSQNIQENNLNNLQFFTEYGRLAMTESVGKKPFQKLIFIVRDWQYPYEYEFGFDGGSRLLEERLKVSPGQDDERQLVRKHIRSCFSEVTCFLLPHPGFKVNNPRFDGRLNDLDALFQEHMKQMVPRILAPDRLVVKEIGEVKLKVRDLAVYFPQYVKVLKQGLPTPKTLFHATSEAHNLAALIEMKEKYKAQMEQSLQLTIYNEPDQIQREHFRIKLQMMNSFDATPKLGGSEFAAKYRERLSEEIDVIYRGFQRQNAKLKLTTWRKPALYLGLGTSSCILLGMVGRLLRHEFILNWFDSMGSLMFLIFVSLTYMEYRQF